MLSSRYGLLLEQAIINLQPDRSAPDAYFLTPRDNIEVSGAQRLSQDPCGSSRDPQGSAKDCMWVKIVHMQSEEDLRRLGPTDRRGLSADCAGCLCNTSLALASSTGILRGRACHRCGWRLARSLAPDHGRVSSYLQWCMPDRCVPDACHSPKQGLRNVRQRPRRPGYVKPDITVSWICVAKF